MTNVDKLIIADEMIESAIVEYFDHKSYFSSLNLACVAEEIYGKYIRITGGKDIQMETIRAAERLVKLSGRPVLPVKKWKKIANINKNSIKHLDSVNDRYIEIEILYEARLGIGDALSNHEKLDRDVTPTIQRFYDTLHTGH